MGYFHCYSAFAQSNETESISEEETVPHLSEDQGYTDSQFGLLENNPSPSKLQLPMTTNPLLGYH